ncbi:class III extradiol ring-cleavage dioxygenase [Shewanella sp. Isolate11]|uniref:DODA-type extradiol aromatic ring-opening family dioxygenase n=1 Tax=Shewanella sp. Isolate11 TaxID=2908530 RepID=UPI001EFD72B2|nr:class III extradiol ring-cleavage dioxygenase [Shewanella sp. Isolate11]MCG9696404.1 dioxygenase [Shewanella sp. Isolate11]
MPQFSQYPALFVSHGSPMLAIEPSDNRDFITQLGAKLPKPDAIVVFSAHFDRDDEIVITSGERPATIHDFYGFPQPLYQLEYPAPGSPELANKVAQLLATMGFAAELDNQQGWDHGVWIPLRLMYPAADIPVVQISINSRAPAEKLYRIGEALKSLRGENILLLGSGGISHNLREVFNPNPASGRQAKVSAFTDWIYQKLMSQDIDSLLDYENLAPHVKFNHPTPEHFIPLFAVLGSQGLNGEIERVFDGIEFEILALDAYRFDA